MIGESKPTIYGKHKYWKVKVKVKRGRLQREESTGRGKSGRRSSYDLFTIHAFIYVFYEFWTEPIQPFWVVIKCFDQFSVGHSRTFTSTRVLFYSVNLNFVTNPLQKLMFTQKQIFF